MYTIKFKEVDRDSLEIKAMSKGYIELLDSFKIESNLPLVKVNLDLINIRGLDSVAIRSRSGCHGDWWPGYLHLSSSGIGAAYSGVAGAVRSMSKPQ